MEATRYQTRSGIRAVVFWDEIAFVAIGLERDICAQGPTADAARKRLDAAIFNTIAMYEEQERPWFEGFGPSPEKYHAMWEAAA